MQRDEVLDVSRGIGILLVIIGHIPLYTFQVNLIYFFHMPLFFFLSGVTHQKQSSRQSLAAAMRLAGNYVIYGLLFSVFGWLYFGHNLQSNLLKLITIQPSPIWQITGFGIYWFIIALTFIKLLCAWPFAYKNWLLGLLLFLTIAYTAGSNTALPAWLIITGPALICLLFYQGGRYYSMIVQEIRKKPTLILLISATLYLSLAIYSISVYNGWQYKLVNLAHLRVFNPFLALILIISGILAALALSYILTKTDLPSRILRFYGKHSFILFVTHLLLIEIFSSLIPQVYWEQNLMLTRTGVLILTIAACTLLALIVERLPQRRTPLRKLLLMQ